MKCCHFVLTCFPLGFQGGLRYLIVSVPDSLYPFTLLIIEARSNKPQWKEKEEEVDNRTGKNTTLKNKQEWTLLAQQRQLKAEQG